MERGEPRVPKNYTCAASGYSWAQKQKIKAREGIDRNRERYKKIEQRIYICGVMVIFFESLL